VLYVILIGIIVKSGAFYTLPATKDELSPTKLGQGREKARDFLEKHRDLAAKIEKEIRDRVLSRVSKSGEAVSADEEEGEGEEATVEAEGAATMVTDDSIPISKD
jgi:hypothetical protein